MITAGKYTARVEAFRAGMHTKKDTGETFPKIELDFLVTAPPSAEGEHITHTLYFSPRGKPELGFKALTACGWDGVSEDELDGLGSVDVELVVEEREYNGKMYPQVKWVNSLQGAGGAAHSPMGEEQKADFGARMRALRGGTAAAPPLPPARDQSKLPF